VTGLVEPSPGAESLRVRADLEAFADHVQNQTNLEVELLVEDDYVQDE